LLGEGFKRFRMAHRVRKSELEFRLREDRKHFIQAIEVSVESAARKAPLANNIFYSSLIESHANEAATSRLK